MNPALNSTLQTPVSSAPSTPRARLAQQDPQPRTSRDLDKAPSLPANSQGLDTRMAKQLESFNLDIFRIKKILEELTDDSILGDLMIITKEDLNYIIQALFFNQDTSCLGCFMNQIYKDPSLNTYISLFEKAIEGLIFNITTDSISNGLPVITEGKILDLNAILDIVNAHLKIIEDPKERSAKIIAYLQLYFLLSAYYEAPVLDKAFSEYSKTRILKLEKLINSLGLWSDLAKLHEKCLPLQAQLFKFCKENPSNLIKIKQDFTCWLMASFTVNKGEYRLLVLDFMNDVFQNSKLKTAFHQEGIDFDKEFSSDPMFVSLMLRAQSKFFEHTKTFRQDKGSLACCDKPTARVHLLQKLERLGLKPEIINKHHPILELALELKDPELLRHLVLAYKLNPYYISDATGCSVWHLFDDTAKLSQYYLCSLTEERLLTEAWLDIKPIIEIKYQSEEDKDSTPGHQNNGKVSSITNGFIEPRTKTINLQNQWSETALIRVAKYGLDATHLFAIKELDLTLKDHTGKTALDYAKENNNKCLVSLIEERKRAITTVSLINTLSANGEKDNYQKLIAFLHKKGNDNLSPIEKSYKTRNTLILEAIEDHLPAISLHMGKYTRMPEGKKTQPLKLEDVLEYLKACFSAKHPEALKKLRLYTYYYYCIHAYIGLEDEALNEAIHSLIALIPDVRDVDTFSQDVIGGLINLFSKTSIDAQNSRGKSDEQQLYILSKRAYANVAHFLVSPVHIKNQSKNSLILDFLSYLSIKAIQAQSEVYKTELNLQRDFFNSEPFFSNILQFCKQNFSTYEAKPVAVVKKLRELGLDRNFFNINPIGIFALLARFDEVDCLKYLILEEGLNPFTCHELRYDRSWSCASSCRQPEQFPTILKPEKAQVFKKFWQNEIEPVLMAKYLILPPHSAENPRIDLIAQGKIVVTAETINLQNQWGETPLIFAAKYGWDVKNLLKVSGIDIQAKDQHQKTALDYAAENQDLDTANRIQAYIKNEKKLSLAFSKINEIYQNTLADKTHNTTANTSKAKKLSKRQVAQLKAEQERLKKQEAEALQKKNQAQSSKTSKISQKPSPAPITITTSGVLEQADNLVYQNPPKEASHLQKAKEKLDKEGKKPEAKKKKSLLARVASGANELKSKLVTAVNIVKDPSKAATQILKQAVERLATSKEVSTRVEAQNKPLLSYPDLLELLDLVQAQDPDFQVARNIQTILEAIDTALNAHYKNPYISFPLQQIETVLQYFYPDMTLSQHGSHRTYHFPGMKAITLATHKENEIFKKALQDVQNRIREALLKKLGIKSYDVSEEAQSPSLTDSSGAESKNESSEEEGPEDN